MTVANWFAAIGKSLASKLATFRLGRSRVTIGKVDGPATHLDPSSIIGDVVMSKAGLPVSEQVGSIVIQVAPNPPTSIAMPSE